ncbi:MAG: glucodextranase DOMON-like domain-containing protein [Candidatus Eisenbacteria bacterium]
MKGPGLVVLSIFLWGAALLAPLDAGLCYDLTLYDPQGDDRGPGTYVYPLDPVFTPGCFDIVRFTARELTSKVRFEIEIAGEITDPWNSGAGFSLQSIDIYIDKDGIAGSGSMAGLERRNVEFSASSAWEYCIWCAPPFDGFETHVVDKNGNTYSTGVTVSVNQTSDVVTLEVPKSIIGTPTATWKYVGLMLSQSGYEPGRVRAVIRDGSQWVLGGGDDSQWDSNVIDMVAQAGVNQEILLANYNASTGVRPILINRADAAAPAISHTPPASWEEHIPLAIVAVVTDDAVVAASAFARKPGQAYQDFPLERTSATGWRGTIPGSEIDGTALEYYISATDGTNSGTLPAPASPFSVPIVPDLTPPVVESLAAQPPVFSPNNDGYKDTTLITADLSEPSFVWLDVCDSLGLTVRRLADSTFAETALGAVWNGKNQSGETVPDGTYTVVAQCRDLAGRLGAPESTDVDVAINQPSRRLDVVLLFHANQNLVPYGKVGNRACYKGVLQTLRAHSSLKFMIHFSGSLLSDLLWFDPETIEILREGVAAGQFEIVGSTYAQNIIYSTRSSSDDFQFNQHQIAIHKALIESTFNATPTSFWNPERVWTQNIVKLLADNGYENVQIEDHILYASGITGSEYAVRTTTFGGRQVNVFDDDKTFEGLVNGAIDSGDTASVMSFLRGLYSEDQNDQ